MSKFVNILFACLAILFISEAIKANEIGLILAFVKNATEFKVRSFSKLARLEPADVKGAGSDDLILEEETEVNYSSLTSVPQSAIFQFYKWTVVEKVELNFEKNVDDVRALRMISGGLPSYVWLVVEVPESKEPVTLRVKVYGKYVTRKRN